MTPSPGKVVSPEYFTHTALAELAGNLEISKSLAYHEKNPFNINSLCNTLKQWGDTA